MGNLLNTIIEATKEGFEINFSGIYINNIQIKVSREGKSQPTVLPISDHAYEEKIIDCIEWSKKQLKI